MDYTQDYSIRLSDEADRDRMVSMWKVFLEEQSHLDSRFVVAEDAEERWLNDFPEWITAGVHAFYVAESNDGELIGFASAHLWYPAPIYRPELEAYLDEIFVIPGSRRQGVATALLEAVRTWARTKDARRIRLGVLSRNSIAASFWEARGAYPFVQTMLIEV